MMNANPFLNFAEDDDQLDVLFLDNKMSDQGSTDPVLQLKIKRRRLRHIMNFGRGANHPSFFLRKFFSKLSDEKYKTVYNDHP
jgi:hypothetical protein